MFINLEKKANKTTMMHYLIVCFNGRFGYVPFTQYFSVDQSLDSQEVFDYDEIRSKICCIKFKMDYVFTEDTVQVFSTSLTNMPVKRNHE
jgi:hypothetical protein